MKIFYLTFTNLNNQCLWNFSRLSASSSRCCFQRLSDFRCKVITPLNNTTNFFPTSRQKTLFYWHKSRLLSHTEPKFDKISIFYPSYSTTWFLIVEDYFLTKKTLKKQMTPKDPKAAKDLKASIQSDPPDATFLFFIHTYSSEML